MTRIRVDVFSLSLGGRGAGPEQSADDPLGRGGEALHDWFDSEAGSVDARWRDRGESLLTGIDLPAMGYAVAGHEAKRTGSACHHRQKRLRRNAVELFYHPLSSYCWKVLIALYENDTAFVPRTLEDPAAAEEWMTLWPIARFPILRDGDAVIAETSVIVEYLDRKAPGPFVAIPGDPDAALEVRLMDRLFDNYVMGSLQTVVFEAVRPAGANRDPHGVEQAKAFLAKAYDLIEQRIAGRTWAAGEHLSLADCAALPSLYYADYIVPFRATHPNLAAYMARLEARPSVARVLQEMQPWFQNFPFANAKAAA